MKANQMPPVEDFLVGTDAKKPRLTGLFWNRCESRQGAFVTSAA